MTKLNTGFLVLFVFMALFVVPQFVSAAGIMISPLRVDVSDSQKYATITVINQDDKEAVRYHISTSSLRMNEDGRMFKPKQPSARELVGHKLLRYSPSTAVIPASGKQVVRLMFKRPKELPVGEYLTYLSVVPEPVSKSKKTSSKGKISTALEILVAVQIPIVIRHGDTAVSVKSNDLKFHRTQKGDVEANLIVQRTGDRSCTISVLLEQILPSGEKVILGKNPRSVIYLPVTKRNIRIPIEDAESLSKGGSLQVTLFDNEDSKKELERKSFPLK